jgi:hypothetical protein
VCVLQDLEEEEHALMCSFSFNLGGNCFPRRLWNQGDAGIGYFGYVARTMRTIMCNEALLRKSGPGRTRACREKLRETGKVHAKVNDVAIEIYSKNQCFHCGWRRTVVCLHRRLANVNNLIEPMLCRSKLLSWL